MSLNMCHSPQLGFIVLAVTSNVVLVDTYVFVWFYCLFLSTLINYFPCRGALHFYWLASSQWPPPLMFFEYIRWPLLLCKYCHNNSIWFRKSQGAHVIAGCVVYLPCLDFESPMPRVPWTESNIQDLCHGFNRHFTRCFQFYSFPCLFQKFLIW